MWRDHGVPHPLGEGFRGLVDFVPQRYDRAELEAAMAKVPIDLVTEMVLWGTPETVHAELRDFVDAGLRHVVFAPVSALASRDGCSVLPAFGDQHRQTPPPRRRLKRSLACGLASGHQTSDIQIALPAFRSHGPEPRSAATTSCRRLTADVS